MPIYRDYRGYEIHFDQAEAEDRTVLWKVVGYGSERAFGSASSREEAYISACSEIDRLESDPYRFPINLVGYPEKEQGDVVTKEGEILGQWRHSGDEALETVQFFPSGAKEALFENHFIGLLCMEIKEWHENL